ncbi:MULTISPECIES: MATE family efflux transporter [Bacillati]|jgi:MATE efflux family protein|uniref:MATE family efflux transporter n=1 Tax=Bacillati TaxID=1783272 RepID=UPI001C149011|nr:MULTISPECIES: MATE family efflux transporter [Clostridia]MCX4203681.1 MATE family efflux transporter [Clostridioides difficile]MDO0038734.1 MATE family efflux transporter [Clostridioides difficile]HBF5717038.1 MATE family efflux transporter [Clostridioides difficile]
MLTKIDFIGGNTRRCLMAMALPMIAAMFLNMAYNLVDSLWIGNLLGKTAYAALTNSTPIILILTSVAMGSTNGVSILLSQAIGSKDKRKTESLIATSLIVAIVFSLLVTLILELCLPTILGALNTPAETYDMAYSYLTIYVLGYVAVYLYLYFTAVLRSFGNSMFQAIAMLVSTVLNAILDPIFIHFIGFQGAAIATLLSQIVCLVFMVIYLKKKKLFYLHITWFDKNDVLPLIQKAIPSVIQQSIPAISTTFLTGLVSTYSITAIAAYGITGKLETILFYPAMALNMVLTTIVGQCIGGQRTDRAKDYLKCALKYGCLLLAILSIVIVVFSKQLSGFFVNSSDVADIVGVYFFIVGIGYLLNTITNSFLGVLNGFGKPAKSMVLMIFYYIVVRMPLAYLLSFLGFGLNGIWFAILISHICAAIASSVVLTLQFKTPK